MRRTKKLIIYGDKRTGSLFIRATTVNKDGKFILKHHRYGRAASRNVSDEDLGRSVREIW